MFDFVGCQQSAEKYHNEGDSFLTFNSPGANPWRTLSKMARKYDILNTFVVHALYQGQVFP